MKANMVNILKGIKTLAALGLIICLFLPLSQCSTPADPKLKKEEVVYERYVVMHKESGVQGYLPVIFFILPIIIVLLNIRVSREKLRYELLELLSGLLVLIVVFLHMKTARLVFGGYLAMSSSAVYILATLYEMWNTISYRRIEQAKVDRDETGSSES